MLGNLGNCHNKLGKYAAAIAHYKLALAVHREIGDRSGDVGLLTNLSVAYANAGEYTESFSISLLITTLYLCDS